MPRLRFIQLLKTRSLYFASAREFNDPWEGSLARRSEPGGVISARSPAAHLERAFEELCRLTKISCWQIAERETAAMWARYSRNDDAVAVQSSVGALADSLGQYRIEPRFAAEHIWLGEIRYIDFQSDAQQDTGMLQRFYYKDLSFEYETEFRAVVSLRGAEDFAVQVPEKGILVPVDPRKLIQSIRVSPLCGGGSMSALTKAVRSAGLRSITVEPSVLTRQFA